MTTLARTGLLSLVCLVAACSKTTEPGAPADAAAPAAAADAAAVSPADAAASPADAAAAAPADAASAAAPDPTPAAGEAASDAPKNLELLPSSWSRKRVEKLMKTYNQALGVDCDHCHEGEDYAAMTEKKRAGREMIKLTRSLNRQFFGGKDAVSCETCHRGEARPGD